MNICGHCIGKVTVISKTVEWRALNSNLVTTETQVQADPLLKQDSRNNKLGAFGGDLSVTAAPTF